MNKHMVENNELDLMDEDWDILIILDACRYDQYEKVFKNILGDRGVLKKAISPATHTPQFLNKIFGDSYFRDIVYISANPYIDLFSYLPKELPRFYKRYKFNGKKHFRKVVDVWKFGYDEEIGTVHPKIVNKAAFVNIDLASVLFPNEKMRFVIHYMQPHAPYLYYSEKKVNETKIKDRSTKFNGRRIISKVANNFLSMDTIWKICSIYGISPSHRIGKIWIKYGKEGIIKGYAEDLKLVLKYVKVLIKNYSDKKILIIADHGELLGEHGKYGHETNRRYKELVEVPWFRVNYV